MGWWPIENDAVLGDRPADLLGNALAEYVSEHGKTSLPSLLAAYRRAMNEGLSSARSDALVARVADGEDMTEAEDAQPALDATLTQALAAVEDSYKEAHGRPPSQYEAVRLLTFVLSGNPDRVLEESPTILDITAT